MSSCSARPHCSPRMASLHRCRAIRQERPALLLAGRTKATGDGCWMKSALCATWPPQAMAAMTQSARASSTLKVVAAEQMSRAKSSHAGPRWHWSDGERVSDDARLAGATCDALWQPRARRGKGLNYGLWKPVGLCARRPFPAQRGELHRPVTACFECVRRLDRVNATKANLPRHCHAPGLSPSFWCLIRKIHDLTSSPPIWAAH